MKDNVYGSSPDLLPEFLSRGAAREAVGARVLTREESRDFEAASLNRFAPGSGGVLDWEGVSHLEQSFYDDEPDAAPLVGRILSDHAPSDAHVVLFWGNLAMPSVTLPVGSLVPHLSEVVEVGPVFWVYVPTNRVIVECRPDGQVTAAAVPHGR